MQSLRKTIQITPRLSSVVRMMSDKKPTSDSSGSIRAAGGSFAKMEQAHEEEYFYKLRQEQLHKLKDKKMSEEQFHEKAIKDHEEQLQKHKEALTSIRNSK